MSSQYHHGDLKAALLTHTLDMVRADQLHLVGFRELARQLGVSRSAPYRHFKDVEELLAATAKECFSLFISRLESATANTALSDFEKFIELGMAYIDFALENPAYFRLMFFHKFQRRDDFPELTREARRAYDRLREIVEGSCTDPITRDELEKKTNLAWASVHGIAILAINDQFQHVRDRKEFVRFACAKII